MCVSRALGKLREERLTKERGRQERGRGGTGGGEDGESRFFRKHGCAESHFGAGGWFGGIIGGGNVWQPAIKEK